MPRLMDQLLAGDTDSTEKAEQEEFARRHRVNHVPAEERERSLFDLLVADEPAQQSYEPTSSAPSSNIPVVDMMMPPPTAPLPPMINPQAGAMQQHGFGGRVAMPITSASPTAKPGFIEETVKNIPGSAARVGTSAVTDLATGLNEMFRVGDKGILEVGPQGEIRSDILAAHKKGMEDIPSIRIILSGPGRLRLSRILLNS